MHFSLKGKRQNYTTPQTKSQDYGADEILGAVCHNNGHYQQRQAVSICTPFAKYWTLSLK